MTAKINVKAKLGLDTFNADTQKHIKVKREVCKDCTERYCLYVCPAQVYTLNNEGQIELDLDGCLECGTCRIACLRGSVDWNYPRGGCGVQYKYG
jgi:ferredoxin like protein